MRRLGGLLLGLYALSWGWDAAPPAAAAEVDGRFSSLWFYATDSRPDDPRSTVRNRLQMHIAETERHNLRLELSGREELDLARDAAGDRSEYQLQEAYLAVDELAGRIDLVVGRQYIPEAAATSLDGGRVVVHLYEGWKAGAFAGATLKDNGLHVQSDFFTYGAFASHTTLDSRFQASLVRDRFRGRRDRDSMNLQGNTRFNPQWRLYGSMTLDFGQPTADPLLSNLYLDLNYRPDPDLSTSVIYSLFQTFFFLESSNPGTFDDTETDDTPTVLGTATTTHRIEGRASYRLHRQHYLDGSLRYQRRTQDDIANTTISVGLREANLFGSEIEVSGRYTLSLSDALDTENFQLRVARTFFDNLQLDASVLHRRSALEIETVVQPSTIYSASAYYTISRQWYAGVNGDHTREEDLRATTLFAQVGYRF